MADWAHGSTAVSTAAVQVLAPTDPPREFAVLYNNGTGPTFFGASNVSTSNGFPINASGYCSLTNRAMANAALFAIGAAARTINILSKV